MKAARSGLCRVVSLVVLALAAGEGARADVRLPAIFGDHAVLQRDRVLPVWGWAEPGEKVGVSLGTQRAETTAGADGRWLVRLGAQPMSKDPLALTVTGKNVVTVADVLLGDVWLCSGQSNMNIGVGHFSRNADVAADIAGAKLPLVRQLGVAEHFADTVQADVKAEWLACSPPMASRFTAVGFYFARKLHAETGVPIGILRAAKGSTTIEMWLSQETMLNELADDPFSQKMKESLATWEQEKAGRQPGAPDYPPYPFGEKVRRPRCVTLHNGMIAPLAPCALRGAIWYQGESNAGGAVSAQQYIAKQRALVQSWRRLFGNENLPFYYVQLPFYREATNDPAALEPWALMREAQRSGLEVSNTHMAVTLDLGDATDIHPTNKCDVGERIALLALKHEYGRADVVASGPLFREMKIEGGRARIAFDSVGGGLMAARKEGRAPAVEEPGAPLRRFALAGADRKWVWADAIIEGDTVLVSSPHVQAPVAVRYAFSSNPAGANLYNRAGLPASPFRTDSW